MLYYVIGGLFFGLFIPCLSRRFAKFMPATPAYALWRLVCPAKIPAAKSFLWRSLLSSLVTAGLTTVYGIKFGSAYAGWPVFYLWTLLLLAEIDWRISLLPDVLTVPLLIGGFAQAALGHGWIIAAESALGAVFGYGLPTLIGILLLRRSKNAFGGGDVKLLAALGAWLGVIPLLYVISASSFLLLGYTLLKQRRSAAYGPILAAAAITVAICFF